MKKFCACLALLLSLALLLCACTKKTQEETPVTPNGSEQTAPADDDTLERPGEDETPDEPDQQTLAFFARVLEADGSALLVEPAQGSAELASAKEFRVHITADTELLGLDGSACTLDDIAVGDTVEITYNGAIDETYPAQIGAQRVAVTAKAQAEQLLTPIEAEWAETASLTGERVTVEESEDAFILRALDDLEKVELARVYYDEQKQDYVQRDLLWMADVWEAGSELAVVEKTPLDGPNLAVSWEDEYGERERRLILPLQVKVDDTLTRNVMLTNYLPPFMPAELSAQIDSEGNGTTAVQTSAYRGVDAYGFAPTKTEIICRMNYDLDGCGRKESVQLLRIWDEYDQYSFALRVVKNGVNYDTGVVMGSLTGGGAAQDDVQLPRYAPQLWLADLDGDNLVEVYFGGDMASDDYAFSAWTVGVNGLERIEIDGQPYLDARIVSIEGSVMQLEKTLHVLGTYSGTSNYCFGATGQLEQLDAYWQIESGTALKLKKALPVVMNDGSQATLPVGTQLYVTATDGQGTALFKTDSGLTGQIAIERSDDGYSWTIAGVSEDDYFETLSYAG